MVKTTVLYTQQGLDAALGQFVEFYNGDDCSYETPDTPQDEICLRKKRWIEITHLLFFVSLFDIIGKHTLNILMDIWATC